MRRHLSTSRSIDNNEETAELLLQHVLEESEQSSFGDSHDPQKTQMERRISRSDSVNVDTVVNVDGPEPVLRIQRSVSVFSARALFSRRSCVLLTVISLVFLILTALLIHKILTSVHELDVPSETKVGFVWCSIECSMRTDKVLYGFKQ